MTTQQVPEIERAVMTILADAEASHPQLRAWIAALANDPDEQRFLNQFPVSPELEQVCVPGCEFLLPRRPDGHLNLFSAIVDSEGAYDTTVTTDGQPHVRPFDRALDQALAWLAAALCSYRQVGRPTGDQEHRIGDGLTLTASLAAAVAAHVKRLPRVWLLLCPDDD